MNIVTALTAPGLATSFEPATKDQQKTSINPLDNMEAAQAYVSKNPGLTADQDDHGDIRILRNNKIVGGKPWPKPAKVLTNEELSTLQTRWEDAQELANKHGWTAKISSHGNIVTRTRSGKIVGGTVSVSTVAPSID